MLSDYHVYTHSLCRATDLNSFLIFSTLNLFVLIYQFFLLVFKVNFDLLKKFIFVIYFEHPSSIIFSLASCLFVVQQCSTQEKDQGHSIRQQGMQRVSLQGSSCPPVSLQSYCVLAPRGPLEPHSLVYSPMLLPSLTERLWTPDLENYQKLPFQWFLYCAMSFLLFSMGWMLLTINQMTSFACRFGFVCRGFLMSSRKKMTSWKSRFC